MNLEERVLDALTPFVEVLEQLGVAYHIGGSVASSTYGYGRTTLDIDLVADLSLEHVEPLAELLGEDYYVDEAMVADAIQRRASFNVIHEPTVMKIDVFIPKEGAFDRLAFRRVLERPLTTETRSRSFHLASPEDVILRKLEWYKAGNMVSERQWNDVLGLFKIRRQSFDFDYLRQWAEELEVDELLERALQEAGL